MNKVLVVIDVQNDFVDGSLGTPEAQAIIPNVVKKIEEYINNEWDIYCTRDTHSESYLNTPEGLKLPVKHCVYKTHGWKLNKYVENAFNNPFNYVPVYNKRTFGCDELAKELLRTNEDDEAIDEIELVGLCTDVCVISNALLFKNKFYDKFTTISVDASCCAGTTPERHKDALEVMKSCQIEVHNE